MKKIYQIPETDVVEIVQVRCFMEELSSDVDPLANENKTFEDNTISSELNPSVNLWDE